MRWNLDIRTMTMLPGDIHRVSILRDPPSAKEGRLGMARSEIAAMAVRDQNYGAESNVQAVIVSV